MKSLVIHGAILAMALSDCVAFIGDPGVTHPTPNPTPSPPTCSANPPATFVPARVRRMTAAEYQSGLTALLGSAASTPVMFPAPTTINGYENHSDALRVEALLAGSLWNASPMLATQAAQSILARPVCQTQDDQCAQQILTQTATKAYRRPASDDEIADLMGVFHTGIDGADFASGITLALQVIVQSAGFLYRTELGDSTAQGAAMLTLAPYEIADELAYLITAAPPDAMLSAAAASGQLTTADGREQQARRLLTLASARAGLGEFAPQWLQASTIGTVNRDSTAYPNWPSIRQSALSEMKSFFGTAVLDGNATLGTLFTANWTVGDSNIAMFYGAGTPDSHTGRISLPAGERSGVLTQAGFLGAHALSLDDSPVQRGHFVRSRVLCQALRPPPPTLVINLPAPDPTETVRQRFAIHSQSMLCQGCHSLMDPIGFGFEHYDATGHYRDMDHNHPVDSTGTLANTDVDAHFDGVVELGQRLAGSAEARDCFAQNWFEWSFAQSLSTDAKCSAQATSASFISGTGTVQDLIVQVVRSEAFVTRTSAM